ncbi:MAG: RluA family pseudouridine synthase [Saprospiraceae bacterium]|nr:RluA family pseudouridine synthase [Saprospiraceae bacterium]
MQEDPDIPDQDQADEEYSDYNEILVDPNQSPIRIDKFLIDRMQRVSRNRLQNAIRAGSIRVDGQEIKPNFKVKPGQSITVLVPKPPHDGVRIVPQPIPIDIIYEDDDLLVLNKTPGMVVHPGVGHWRGTLVNALAYHFQKNKVPTVGDGKDNRVGLVHRIDKNTSGLMVVAKTEFAMSHLAKQFFYHTVQRTYYALVWGEPKEDFGTVRGHVGRDRKDRQLFTVFPEGDHGKWAVTHYKVLERLYYVSLIQCNLETGRTHQIRVHLKHIGNPLFSDERYGGDVIVKGTVFSKYKMFVQKVFNVMPRHALHAKSLGFIHPTTGEAMLFDSELPPDFQEALDEWRKYVEVRKAAVAKSGHPM